MLKCMLLFCIAFMQLGINIKGQSLGKLLLPVALSGTKPILASRDLVISANKTCMLIFPAAIQSADRGAAYVLAQRVKGAENILKVKAGKAGFEPSSLTVVTKDGQVFAFRVRYEKDPPYLVLDLRRSDKNMPAGADSDEAGNGAGNGATAVRFKGTLLNSAEMQRSAALVKGRPCFVKGVRVHKQSLDFGLEGIYIHGDVLFFSFRLFNGSGIPFELGSLRFFIRDVKTAKRTAVQDNELNVLFMQSWGTPEAGKTQDHEKEMGMGRGRNKDRQRGQMIVVALDRFTMADKKALMIDLREKEGDRSVVLRLKERKLLKAEVL